MSIFTKVILALSLVFISNAVSAQWIQTNYSDARVKIFGATPTNIFCYNGVTSGFFRSTDYGLNWQHSNQPPDFICENSLKVFNTDVYLGTFPYMGTGGGLYRSSNEGVNWTKIGFNNHSVILIEVSSTSIFLYTDTGFYRSSNNGAAWTQIPLIDNNIRCIASNGLNVYVGSKGIIYRSTNNGINWTSFSSGLPPATRFNKIVVSGSNIFISGLDTMDNANGGIYKSVDNCQSWTSIGLTDKKVTSLSVAGYNLFAGTRLGGVYLSTNAGVTWIQKNQGMTSYNINAFLIFGDYVLAAETVNLGVWRRFLLDIIGINKISTEIPNKFSLNQNTPNPFNPSTKIEFQVPNDGFITLKVFNIDGKEIETLVNEKVSAGTYETTWNASKFSSGVYFYRIETLNFVETKKMILLK